MQKNPSLFLVTVAFIVWLSPTAAWAGTATAEIDHTSGGLDDEFRLVLSISGKYEGDAPPLEIPGLEIYDAGVSRNVQWINGTVSSEIQYSYVLKATQPGKFTVPSFKLKVDDQEIATLPISFQVEGAPGGANQSPPNQAAPPQSAPDPGAQNQDPLSGARGDFFIDRKLSTKTPYVGEPILSTIRIFYAGRLVRANPIKETAPEFRVLTVQGEKNYQQIVQGKRYSVVELNEVLIPLRPGKINLPPYSLATTIWQPVARRSGNSGSVWDLLSGGMFDRGQEVNRKLSSLPDELTIQALPKDGQPKAFNGLVGEFQMSSEVSTRALKQGETATVTVKLEGVGALDSAPDLSHQLAAVGKIYPDKPETSEKIDVNRPSGPLYASSVYKYAVVPERPGTFSLGVIEVPIFNPKLKQYVTLRAELGSLDVSASASSPARVSTDVPSVPESQAKSSVKILNEDLLPLHEPDLVTSDGGMTARSIVYYGVGATAPLVFAAFCGFIQRYREERLRQSGKLRKSRAHKTIKKVFADAETLVGSLEFAKAAEVLYRGFKDYVGAKTDQHGQALTARELVAALTPLAHNDAERDACRALVAKLEHVAFAGADLDMSQTRTLISDLQNLVNQIERSPA